MVFLPCLDFELCVLADLVCAVDPVFEAALAWVLVVCACAVEVVLLCVLFLVVVVVVLVVAEAVEANNNVEARIAINRAPTTLKSTPLQLCEESAELNNTNHLEDKPVLWFAPS